MGFQSSVALSSGFGVPGELYVNDPRRSKSYILDSTAPALNIVGATAYTIVSEGVAEAGGTGIFAGILIMPKSYALFGVGGIPLAPTLTLPNDTQAEILSMGTIIVTLPAAADIGDVVIFDQATGVLSTQAQAAGLPVGSSYANAFVSYYTVDAPGLAVITVNPVEIVV